MKISLNWIKEYVELPADKTVEDIAYDLTMATVEVEGWRDISREFDNIVIGEIKSTEKHPNADKLTLCQTDIGGGEIKEIVCGGVNVAAGVKVAVSLPGAMVRWHGVGELAPIGITKVRGVKSFGMICASSEIGLYDLFPEGTDNDNILDLSHIDAPAGTNVADALGICDIILEIDNKSLTNRPDLWGHYGIAREFSALYGVPLKPIEKYKPKNKPPLIDITLEDTALSQRYIGVKIENLSVKPAPFEIQTMLWRVGLRPINAIVDITNYVMLATGQPTHAFDSDKIEGHITVRRAKPDEKLLLLDDKELTLTTDDLVIADDAGAVGLAGVMGGKRDSVLDGTNKIILEIANFHALSIRRTAARHDARTDAATRFEKGIDPQRADITLPLAIDLFKKIYPEMKITGMRDCFPVMKSCKIIDVSLDWLANRLGMRLPEADIKKTLELLGFKIGFSTDGDTMHVAPPTWRATGDVSIPDDIMEEVARMYGYEKFATMPITTSFTHAINQPAVDLDRKIREFLAFRCGMREIFSYPWVADDYIDAILGGTGDSLNLIGLSAPPAPDETYLRPSLIPNICKAVATNIHNYESFAIFESAQIFKPGDFIREYDADEALPVQRRNIAGAFVGAAENITTLFRTAKGAMEALPRAIHIEGFDLCKDNKPHWADDTVWLNLAIPSQAEFPIYIGNIGLLSKKAALAIGIKTAAVMLFELNIDALAPLPSRDNKFTHLPQFPFSEYDQSLLFDRAVKWADIYAVATAKKGDGDILRGVRFIDEYTGKKIPEGKKSITFRLTIGSLTKTLTSAEIDAFANSVAKRLSKELGAEIRTE